VSASSQILTRPTICSGTRFPTDTNSGGGGVIRNLSGWDLDMTVTKDLSIRERFGIMFIFQSTNVLNHVVLGAPNFALGSPTTFGVITASAASYNPRQIEFRPPRALLALSASLRRLADKRGKPHRLPPFLFVCRA